jgi:hypothetical protein
VSKKIMEAPPVLPPPHVQRVLELEHSSFKEEALERLRIQASLAQSCFRMLVIANGGAIVAIFTLIGSNARIAASALTASLWIAFGCFAAGLAFTIGAIVSGYFMQYHYTNVTAYQMWNKEREMLGQPPAHEVDPTMKAGGRWEIVAVVCTVLGLVGFIVGSAFCFLAFLGGGP